MTTTATEFRLMLDQPTTAVIARKGRASYDTATHGRRTIGWNAPTTSPNSGLLGNLATLRDRSRAALRNDGYARSAVEKLVSNVIGTGIQPLSKADVDLEVPHPLTGKMVAYRVGLQALWQLWTDESDADGLLDWYGQQTQAARGWFGAGEMFVRLRLRDRADGLRVPLQVQLLEPEMCPHSYSIPAMVGNTVRAGIEFDRIGRRVAYWFYASRPGYPNENYSGEMRRVPADLVIPLYDPLRAGQLRGEPQLTPALLRLYGILKTEDATLLRHELQNMFMGFRTRAASQDVASPLHGLTGQVEDTDDKGRPVLVFEPGVMQDLEPGEEMTWSEPPEPGQTLPDFLNHQLRGAFVAAEVPYELVNMSGVNDRQMRVVANEFRRRVQVWQHQIISHQLCRRVWNAFVDRVYDSGALPIPDSYLEDPAPWRAVKWMPQGWPYINPVQDVAAAREEVRAGLASRASKVAERGDDVEEVDAERLSDQERADRLALVDDTDVRKTSRAGVTQVRPAGGEPLAEGEGAPE